MLRWKKLGLRLTVHTTQNYSTRLSPWTLRLSDPRLVKAGEEEEQVVLVVEDNEVVVGAPLQRMSEVEKMDRWAKVRDMKF